MLTVFANMYLEIMNKTLSFYLFILVRLRNKQRFSNPFLKQISIEQWALRFLLKESTEAIGFARIYACFLKPSTDYESDRVTTVSLSPLKRTIRTRKQRSL